jgi:hypothetical protein
MNKQPHDYKVIPYPKLRRALALTLRSAQRKSMIHGLIEVDVTSARMAAGPHSENWRALVLYGLHNYLFGKSSR